MVQLKALTSIATDLENLDPPLSIATRLRSPEKIIAIPAPTNQRVSVFICNGKAKLICTIPSRIIMADTILIRLSTAGLIHLYRGAFYSSIAAKHTAIASKRL
jgi:hypothetical protein